jgi:type II secretory pathway component PulJ
VQRHLKERAQLRRALVVVVASIHSAATRRPRADTDSSFSSGCVAEQLKDVLEDQLGIFWCSTNKERESTENLDW